MRADLKIDASKETPDNISRKLAQLSFSVIAAIILAACQQDNEPLPTLIDLNVVAAAQIADAATATESARLTGLPTATRVRTGPTLPPTFTPTPLPTVTPIDPASVPTSTPEGYNPAGVIYYIYNGDAIMTVQGDGSSEQIIETFGVGQMLSDLTLSPDGELLAYIAPGNGLAREVYISSLDGTYRQQVTCLNYREVRNLTWSPDSERLAFIAAPESGAPSNVYSASWIGANACPTGNRQIAEVTLNSLNLRDVAYSPDGNRLFFSDNEIYALDLTTRTVSPPLTVTLGFGPDFELEFRPGDLYTLTYLRSSRNPPAQEGTITIINVESINRTADIIYQESAITQSIQWGKSGNFLLVSSLDSALLFNWNSRLAKSVVTALDSSPQAVLNPAENRIAYVAPDPANPAIPQIFVTGLDGFDQTQITFHTEGTIQDMIWIETRLDQS